MESRGQRWGRSPAVRIPESSAAEGGLSEDAAVELTVKGCTLVITPPVCRTYRLSERLANVRRSNLHHETATGPPQGDETW